jgi:hypothetical protein
MSWWSFTAGVLAAGALMYYIQPWVHDTVAKTFAGIPTLQKKVEELRTRAEALRAAAQKTGE